jgi:hypothetical protein
MKRIAVIAAAIAMFASTAAIALADEAAESPGDEPESSEERVLNEAQMRKVNVLADYWLSGEEAPDDPTEGEETEFGAGDETSAEPTIEDEIEALRTGEIVVGWGAMFKLMQLARLYYPDMSLTKVASMIKGEDEGWAFGRRFNKPALDADGEELKSDDASPKNFGQLKKQYREENGNRDKKPKRP